MKELSEDQWVKEAKSLKRRPPMPWFILNKMPDENLRAVYQFIRALGDPGNQAPDYFWCAWRTLHYKHGGRRSIVECDGQRTASPRLMRFTTFTASYRLRNL